jgi:hypothetical protein
MFDERRISLRASTKSGKTVSGIIWLYEQAMHNDRLPGQNFWWVAPVFSQSRIAFNRMRRHFLDEQGHTLFSTNLTDHTLITSKDTIISFRSGDHPDTLYGEDVYACVIDEALQAGVLAKEEIEEAKSTLPEHVFRELYLAEPAEDEGTSALA